MSIQIKKNTFTGIMIAIAYITLYYIRIPIIPTAPFLRLDIKDVFILIPGILYGPLYTIAGAVCVSFLQMFTVSEYGFIGLIMNILSVTAYTLPVIFVYKKKSTNPRLILGLVFGCISMTVIMLLWNYLISPLYMGVDREVIVKMLIPVFLPFNLIKSVLDSIIVYVFFNIIKKYALLRDYNGN